MFSQICAGLYTPAAAQTASPLAIPRRQQRPIGDANKHLHMDLHMA